MTVGMLSFTGVPTGNLLTVTIADGTAMDVQSGVGPNGSGWVAYVTLKGLTSLTGTVAPSALSIQVSDPGFDASGNVTTVTRTITGVCQVRRQWPNADTLRISTDGANLTLLISLDDWIYSATSIVSASIGSTFYSGCNSSSVTSGVNLSVTPYTKPLFGWINPQQDLSGSSFAVECVAFHRHATSGRQVACIKLSASDGTTTSPTVTVASTSLSSKITKGFPPEVWKASLDMSSLAQATMCTANAKVYPWIGDSSAILDLSVDGVAWPTALPITPLRILNDRTGGYGGVFAYVKVGASGGTVSTVAATAAGTPFPTIAAALDAIRVYNNANKGHNDFGGGTVRLMDTSGAATTHSVNETPSNLYGQTWCNIEKDPASSAVISVTWLSLQNYPQMLRWRNLRSFQTSGVRTFLGYGETNGMICFDNFVYDTGSEITAFDNRFLYNMSVATASVSALNGGGSTTSATAIVAGMDAPILFDSGGYGAALLNSTDCAKLLIGCNIPSITVVPDFHGVGGGGGGDDGRIVYNNSLFQAVMISQTTNTIAHGMANVQNLYETTAQIAANWFADGDVTTINNYIEMHTTAVGGKSSRMYNDEPYMKIAPYGIVKNAVSKYSIWSNYNFKSDTFNGGVGAPGNWAYGYSVGNVGNISLFGSIGEFINGAPDNDSGGGYEGFAWLPSSDPGLFSDRTGLNTYALVMGQFTNYTTEPFLPKTGGGNYVPKNTSTLLKNRVPAGKHVLLRDLAGVLRKTDGTGAAGAFEAAP